MGNSKWEAGSQKPNVLQESLSWHFWRDGRFKPKNSLWKGYGCFREKRNPRPVTTHANIKEYS